MTRAWVVAGAFVAACLGCRHHHSASFAEPPALASDSLFGIVSVTGTSFEEHLVLRTASGTRALVVTSEDSAALTRLGGVEIVAYGSKVAERFALASFEVRTVDGAHVFDGMLARHGDRYMLRTRHEELLLGNPPTAFEALVGARLWVGGPLDSGPNVYGVIRKPST